MKLLENLNNRLQAVRSVRSAKAHEKFSQSKISIRDLVRDGSFSLVLISVDDSWC